MYWECHLIRWYFVTALTPVIINTAFHKIFFQYLPIASLLLTNFITIGIRPFTQNQSGILYKTYKRYLTYFQHF